MFLSGLVYCAHCGKPMIARTDHLEYFCSTWEHHRKHHGPRGTPPCQRNGVKQALLEELLLRFLEEAGHRVDLLDGGGGGNGNGNGGGPGAGHLLDRLREDHVGADRRLYEGLDRLTRYLAEHHPDEYAVLCKRDGERAQEEAALRDRLGEPMSPGAFLEYLRGQGIDPTKPLNGTYNPLWVMPDFAHDCLELYRAVFNPKATEAELAELDAEHGRQMEKWDRAPTPLYKEKAKARLDALEGRIQELKRQQEDAAQAVSDACRELYELQTAICDAREALRSEGGEHALRRRAEAVRRALRGGKKPPS
jgi:hypothetical protein